MPENSLFGYKYRRFAMTILLIANFMIFLDVNIVNVALPSLQQSLGATQTNIQWIVTTYILVYALALLPLGRMGDLLGRKIFFVTGVLGFTLASFLCGVAVNIPMLIMARGLQAIFAAMITPQVMAIAQAMFAPPERAKAFSLFGLIAGLAAIAGPVVSGFLIKANVFDFGWRSIFYVNIPMGLVLPLLAIFRVPSPAIHQIRGPKIDWIGVILATGAMFCLIFPIIEGRIYHWPLWFFAIMAMFPILLIIFILHSLRQFKKGGPLLLPIHILSNRDYLIGAFSLMIFYSAMLGFFLVFILFLQQGLHFSPFYAGWATISFPIGILLASTTLVRFFDLRSKILSGTCLSMFSMVILWKITAGMDADITIKSLIFPLLVGGIGSSLIIASLFQAVMKTVPLKDAGVGAGALNALQQIGGALGVACVSQIFFSSLATHMKTNFLISHAYVLSFQATIIYYLLAYLLVGIGTFFMKFAIPSNVIASNQILMNNGEAPKAN